MRCVKSEPSTFLNKAKLFILYQEHFIKRVSFLLQASSSTSRLTLSLTWWTDPIYPLLLCLHFLTIVINVETCTYSIKINLCFAVTVTVSACYSCGFFLAHFCPYLFEHLIVVQLCLYLSLEDNPSTYYKNMCSAIWGLFDACKETDRDKYCQPKKKARDPTL